MIEGASAPAGSDGSKRSGSHKVAAECHAGMKPASLGSTSPSPETPLAKGPPVRRGQGQKPGPGEATAGSGRPGGSEQRPDAACLWRAERGGGGTESQGRLHVFDRSDGDVELPLTAVGGVKLEPGQGRGASAGVEMPARGLEGYVRRDAG